MSAGTRPPRRPEGLALALVLLCACASGEGRLEGRRYERAEPPFVARDLATLSPAPGLPDAGRSLVHRVLLVGDAGDPEDQPTLAALGRWSRAHPEATTVVFLGDALPDRWRRETGEALLQRRLEAAGGTRIFLPGEREWGLPDPESDRLLAEQRLLDAQPGARRQPRDGCAGPETLQLVPAGALERGAALVTIDSQWWLLPERVRPPCGDLGEPAAALAGALGPLADHWVIVAAHHPLRTGGPRGGLRHPTGIAGLLRGRPGSGGVARDTFEPDYARFVAAMEAALSPTRPLVYAAGHDHSLQLLRGGAASHYEIVSGAGSARVVSSVTTLPPSLFAHAHPGFFAIDFHRGARGDEVLLHVVETGSERPVLTTRLAPRKP